MRKNTALGLLIGVITAGAGTQQLCAQAGNSGTFNTPAFGGTGSGAVNVNNNRVNSTGSTNRATALGSTSGSNPGTSLGQPTTALGQQGTGTAITAPAGTVAGGANGSVATPQGTGIAIGQQGTTAPGQQGATATTPQTNGFVVNPDGTTPGTSSQSAQGASTGTALGGTNTDVEPQTPTNGFRPQ